MRFDVLLSTVLLLMMITYASAIGEIAQTYVGGNDATELVRAFNDWIDENGAESWSKVVVKEFPGMFCLTLISTNKHTQTQQNKHTHTHTHQHTDLDLLLEKILKPTTSTSRFLGNW